MHSHQMKLNELKLIIIIYVRVIEYVTFARMLNRHYALQTKVHIALRSEV